MFCFHLLLLQCGPLGHKLVQQLVQHLDDAVRLELIPMGLGGTDGKANGRVLLEKGVDGLLGILRNEGQLHKVRHLHEGGLAAVVGLLLQHRDRTLQGIHGLGVVLVHRGVVRLLQLADLGGGLLVAVPDRDVLVMARNLLGQHGGVGRVFGDVGLQHIDLLVGLRNRPGLLDAGVVAELLVRGKLDLLRVLFLLAVLHHALQQLDHLLDRGDR
mmetsp:Transcript_136217/g.423285  ORF Transcript_136217/g.423285 Transcript_136217/m.423285 type:complete len:214 (-) Transcript_136217:114-755(-)